MFFHTTREMNGSLRPVSSAEGAVKTDTTVEYLSKPK